MTAPRIRSLTVKGFRAFGGTEQTLKLPGEIGVVWGPNSKGKSSLAEAFEFLLTGKIARRELLGSTQDEFADALRNAHLAPDDDVYVHASILGTDGNVHEVRRALTDDYSKRQDCVSVLEIDGLAANGAALEKLGITLSEPPLSAPVLDQHTLGYLFSVGPLERANYFKTLLEVKDLDHLREEIAGLESELAPPASIELEKFDRCVALLGDGSLLKSLSTSAVADTDALSGELDSLVTRLISPFVEKVPDEPGDRLDSMEEVLRNRRGETFPVSGFDRREMAGWNEPSDESWKAVSDYVQEREGVDQETAQLAALFSEALKLPSLQSISDPVDCPLCATDSALSPERTEFLREHVETVRDFRTAEARAKATLEDLARSADAAATAARRALPEFLRLQSHQRRRIGFTIPLVSELLGEQSEDLVSPWLQGARRLARAVGTVRRNAEHARDLALKKDADGEPAVDPDEITGAFSALTTGFGQLTEVIDTYRHLETPLTEAINEILDAQAHTEGWQDLMDIAKTPGTVRAALLDRLASQQVVSELSAALKEIDQAKERVLSQKFSEYSDTIQAWWERLRPDEPTFFSALEPRKGTKRTIDLKAGLSPTLDRSAAELRDVIAVFSQSQLHCLGLSLFLARAQREGLGFVVLDDPVLSSDEDYRVHFNSTVLSALLDLPIQVIVLTQDHATWEELEIRYRHVGISTAQLFVENPADGSVIENTSDALLARINRARSLARGGHPDSRKECGIHLRDAGERFCKEMLVVDREAAGDSAASLSDYDGKTLEWLCPRIEPLLDHDASHPGKFRAFKKTVNNACHDNAPPGNAEMTQACGEIGFLVKEYLGR